MPAFHQFSLSRAVFRIAFSRKPSDAVALGQPGWVNPQNLAELTAGALEAELAQLHQCIAALT